MTEKRSYDLASDGEKVKEILQVVRPKRVSMRDLVIARAAEVRAAQEKGASYSDIAEALTAAGYAIKASTLKSIMTSLPKGPGKTAGKRAREGAGGG